MSIKILTKLFKARITQATLLSVTLLLSSTSALANLKQIEKLYTQEGYPYEPLVRRADEVKIIYEETGEDIRCRVEVLQKGKIWQGEEQNIKAKSFNLKPLRSCLARAQAKQLLTNTH